MDWIGPKYYYSDLNFCYSLSLNEVFYVIIFYYNKLFCSFILWYSFFNPINNYLACLFYLIVKFLFLVFARIGESAMRASNTSSFWEG
jgi:hypothetical protein